MPSCPPVCTNCNGSGRLIVIAKDIHELPSLPSLARMWPGVGYESPRPICPECFGEGTLHEFEPHGEYPPPPKQIKLSKDQEQAIFNITEWLLKTTRKRFALAGFAGTGKTTILSTLLKLFQKHLNIKVCAPTGKAASVLKQKGVPATTLHKLVYTPEHHCLRCRKVVQTIKSGNGKQACAHCTSHSLKTTWTRVPIIDADLVIIDEASMLNEDMVRDIEDLALRVLYVGDHGQLEPIGKDPGIMRSPNFRLEKIHRQAAQSGIIQLAHHMRTGRQPARWDGYKFHDARVTGICKLAPRVLSRFDVILCGYNKTRKDVNSAIRKFRGFKDPLPEPGERIICLQNDSDLGLFNGLLVTVTARRESYELPRYDMVDDVGNEYLDIQVYPEQFEEEKKIEHMNKGIGLFDFGYCLTAHKAQGSEWNKVAVIEQIAASWNPARWRYTAATRAAEHLEYWLPTRGI